MLKHIFAYKKSDFAKKFSSPLFLAKGIWNFVKQIKANF